MSNSWYWENKSRKGNSIIPASKAPKIKAKIKLNINGELQYGLNVTPFARKCWEDIVRKVWGGEKKI